MAIIYVDLLNGVDANNGTTFALRKKTLSSASIGRAAGDVIRVMATSDPTLLGTCTWAAANNYITLPAAVNAVINLCDTAWTASANITCSTSTTAANFRQGTSCVMFSPAAGFTTGKMAYAPCATVNLSAYQQVSFYFSPSSVIPANTFYLDLCSDALGATPVASFLIPAFANASNVAVPLTFNFGANLSATVNSVALRAALNPGTATCYLDNIVACKAASSADSLTLNSVIGLNTADEPEWYPIRCIEGTKVTLDIFSTTITNIWGGSVGSLATYKLEPLRIQQTATSLSAVVVTGPATWIMASGGTSAGMVSVEFGWDTTAMTTQSGITAFDFQSWAGAGLPSSKDYVYVNKLVSIRSYEFFTNLVATATNLQYGTVHSVNPYTLNFFDSTNGIANLKANSVYITCPSNYSTGSIGDMNIVNLSLKYRSSNYTGGTPYYGISVSSIMVQNFDIFGWTFMNFANTTGSIKNFTFGGTGTATSTGLSAASTNLYIDNYVCSNSASAVNLVSFTPSTVKINICTTTSVTNAISVPTSTYVDRCRVSIASLNGATVGAGYAGGTQFYAVTSPLHTTGAGKYAWAVDAPVDKSKLATDAAPWAKHKLSIGQVLVNPGTLVTVSIWCYRLFTTTPGALFIQPDFGSLTDYVVSTTTGAAQTWEQLTITFTPATAAVIDIFVGVVYDAASPTQIVYFDDFSVSQA